MSRIFTVLAIVSTTFLIVAVVLGLWTGDYNGEADRYRETIRQVAENDTEVRERKTKLDEIRANLEPIQSRTGQHRLVAIFSSLAVIFVNCISVTYFIGTNRWGKEVVEAYSLDASYSERIRKLKKSSFPFSLAGVVMVMVTASFGAAADPATGYESTSKWVTTHFLLGISTLAVVVWSFFNQVKKIKGNTDVTQEIESEVHRIRLQHGLDVESD